MVGELAFDVIPASFSSARLNRLGRGFFNRSTVPRHYAAFGQLTEQILSHSNSPTNGEFQISFAPLALLQRAGWRVLEWSMAATFFSLGGAALEEANFVLMGRR
jgi:hypothetical protein